MSGNKAEPKMRRSRLVPRGRDDRIKVVRIGNQHRLLGDVYASLLALHWFPLLAFFALFYLVSNLSFASLYYWDLVGVENARSFGDTFFFSVQTMATIGYGTMTPSDTMANVIVTVEAFWGFGFFAFVTGLVFTKFSRPKARVLFSNIAVISNYNGKPHLKIRLANQRANRIVNAHVKLAMLDQVTTLEGQTMRQFRDLKLVRDHIPLLVLTWTVLHPIDEESPLFGLTSEQLCANEDEIIASLSGLDETLSQTIYAHHSYLADEIMYGGFFEDILVRKQGQVEVNYNLFHTLKKPGHEQTSSKV